MVVMATPPRLRERQAQIARDSILDAVIAKLESASWNDFSMQDIAEAAGVSLRTLYRYFPNREEVLRAAGGRIGERLELAPEISGPEEIVSSFLKASGMMARHLQLARALVATSAGRDARSPLLQRRRSAIDRAMSQLTAGLDQSTARQVTAVVTFLCNAASWMTISDDYALSSSEARNAVAWALEQLLNSLRNSADGSVSASSGETIRGPSQVTLPDP